VISLLDAPGGPKRASRAFDDEHIRKYRSFLLRWRQEHSVDNKMRLFPMFPNIYHAQRFHDRHDSEAQAVLEARILSGASNSNIAHCVATDPGVVRMYEKLFFNVRDRLDRTDYIRDMVVTPTVRRAVSFGDQEILTDEKRHAIYKLMAYVGGPQVLDFILIGFERKAAPSRAAQLIDWMDSAYNNLTRQRAIMLMQAFSFNKFTVMQMLEMCRGVVQSAEDARLAGGAVTEFHSNVAAFFDQVKLSVGKQSTEGVPKPVLTWESGQVEPRAEDYYDLAKNESPEDLKVFDGFARPEPIPKEV